MRHSVVALLILLSALGSSSINAEWRLKSVKENYHTELPFTMPASTEIEFSNGHMATTDVIEFEFIDFVKSGHDHTFIIFSGRTCSECDMNTSIYIKSVSESEYSNGRFRHPGKLVSYMDGELIEESRMFYGNCLEIGDPTIVFYTLFLGNDGAWHKSVYDLDFDGNQIVKNPALVPYENLSQTELLVKSGKCREVWGATRSSEP